MAFTYETLPRKEAPPLTWDAVIELIRQSADGLTNDTIRAVFAASYQEVSMLTKIMWRAGVLERVGPVAGKGFQGAYIYRVPGRESV